MTNEVSQNMGSMDRIIRAAIGGMLFSCGKENKNFFTFGMGLAFIFYALSGWDPLLSLFKTTTHPDDDNGLIKKCMEKAEKAKQSVASKVGNPQTGMESVS